MWMREGQLLHSGSLTKREAAFTAIILAGEPEEMCKGSPESWEKSLKTWFHASRQRKALMVYKFPLRTQLSYLESFTGSKIGSSSLQTADRGPNVAKQTVLYTFCWNIVKPEYQKSHKKQINVSLKNKSSVDKSHLGGKRKSEKRTVSEWAAVLLSDHLSPSTILEPQSQHNILGLPGLITESCSSKGYRVKSSHGIITSENLARKGKTD